MNEKCFVVVHINYADGITACVYKSRYDAAKAVEEELNSVKEALLKDGYSPVVIYDTFRNPELYAAGGNIYYEWQIIETTIWG